MGVRKATATNTHKKAGKLKNMGLSHLDSRATGLELGSVVHRQKCAQCGKLGIEILLK